MASSEECRNFAPANSTNHDKQSHAESCFRLSEIYDGPLSDAPLSFGYDCPRGESIYG